LSDCDLRAGGDGVCCEGGARVLVLDASEEAGALADDLGRLAARMESERGLAVLGPEFAGPFEGEAPALPASTEVEELLQLAEQQYGDFDTEAARRTLLDASRRIGDLTDGEHGELLVRFHWLFAQLAIVEGEVAAAEVHLDRIVQRAPWWEPPKGYLTPEAADAFAAQRAEAVSSAAVVDLVVLPPDAEVWVDGFSMKEFGTVRVVPGLHLVRVEQPGYAVWRRWFDLAADQRLVVQPPVIPRWDADARAGARAALASGDVGALGALVGGLAQLADASLAVVAFSAGSEVQAAALSVAEGRWAVEPSRGALSEFAGALCGVPIATNSRGAARPAAGVFTLSLGGSGRVVGGGDEFIAPGGGPSIELGGGVAINGVLEIRVLGGVAFHGGSSLSLPLGGSSVSSMQRSYLVRVGAVVGPRIPLGRAAYLWLGGGGGLGITGLTGAIGEGTATSVSAAGGMVMASAFLGLTPWPGVRFGPSAGFVHAGAPTTLLMLDGGTAARLKATSYSAVEFGVQMAIGR